MAGKQMGNIGYESHCHFRYSVGHNLSLSYFRYILAAKTNGEPDDYVFVYYRGKNDAWDGYGGAVVYTRSKILPPSIIPELQQAAKRVKLDFNKFTPTDNTCGPEPPLFARLEKKVSTISLDQS